jgi:hypothetical protein
VRTITRRLHLAVPPGEAFALCLRLLQEPDPARGVVARRCIPAPPVAGGSLISTVRGRGGDQRELRATIVELAPPHAVSTASDEGPPVRTSLQVAPDGDGSAVVLRSEVTAALAGGGRLGSMLDTLIFGGAQRRAARATLLRLRALAEGRAEV